MEKIKLSEELMNDHIEFCKVMSEAETLRAKKLADYGKSYKNFGLLGVIVRMDDKMARMKSILKSGHSHNESMRDSLIDIANYAIMGAIIMDEEAKNGVQ